MFIIMKPWKILQRHTYDLLSHKYSLVIIIVAFTTILVSIIQFGEVAMSWSHDRYEAVFTSFSDNVGRRSFQSSLCQSVPIDAVYTWVNGSDPELARDLGAFRERLARETSERCPYAACVPTAVAAYGGWLEEVSPSLAVTISLDASSPTRHIMTSSRNWTLLSFATQRDATLACSRPLPVGGDNVTLSHAHMTSDPTAPGAIALPDTLLLVGVAWRGDSVTEAVREAFPVTRVKVEPHADKGVVVVTLQENGVARDILKRAGNVTLSGAQFAVRAAFLIPELPSSSHPRDFSASRFEDKDELRYSLRSLERFAPWVRHVYVVTNGQLPHWLDLENPRMTVVTHSEIFPDPNHLPTFSSPAIESHLHRIPGLSTLFLYLNDDVMFGREVWPEDFITPANGQKVYLSWGVPDCSPACPWSWVGDGACDPQCNNTACFYDNGDCQPDRLASEEEEQQVYQQMAHMVGEDLSAHDDQRGLAAELQNSEAERNIDDIFNDRRKRDVNGRDDAANLHRTETNQNQRNTEDNITNENTGFHERMPSSFQRRQNLTKEDERLGSRRARRTNHSARDGLNQSARQGPIARAVPLQKHKTDNGERLRINPPKADSIFTAHTFGGDVQNGDLPPLLDADAARNPYDNAIDAVIKPRAADGGAHKDDAGDESLRAVRTRDILQHAGEHDVNITTSQTNLLPNISIKDGRGNAIRGPRVVNASYGHMEDVLRHLYDRRGSSLVGRAFNRAEESRYRLRGRYAGGADGNMGRVRGNAGGVRRNVDGVDGKVGGSNGSMHGVDGEEGGVARKVEGVYRNVGGVDDGKDRGQMGYIYQLRGSKHVAGNKSRLAGGGAKETLQGRETGSSTEGGLQDASERSLRPANATYKRRGKLWPPAGAARSERPGHGSMDTFAESLLYVNQLLNRAYGFVPRKVPAHMPHLVDRDVMERLQDRFSDEWWLTSSHRVRSSRDMQFAFSYFYYLMSEKVNVSMAEIFQMFDTDRSGTWSDRELRTLLTRLFEVPLSYHRVLYVEQLLTNCSLHSPPESLTTPPYERYQDSKLPIISQRLVTSCRPIVKLLSDKFGQRNRYKFEIVKDRTQDVSFKMLSSNLSHLVQHLDDVRRQPKKFVCLNDNLDPNREGDNAVARAVLQDFYESLFPMPSTFELPPDLRNRFLHVRELDRWRENRARLRSAVYVCLLGLAAFTAINLFHAEFRTLHRRLFPGKRSRSQSKSEPV